MMATEEQYQDKKLVKNGSHLPRENGVKNSPLVDLYENKHIATVYNLFLVILLYLFINQLVYSFVLENAEFKLGFNLLIKGYYRMHIAIAIWFGMFVASLISYYGFKIWAFTRIGFPQNSTKIKLWDKFMICLLIIYYGLFLYFPPLFITRNEVPMLGTATLLCESMRILMTLHSFIRTNATRVVHYKKTDDSIIVPTLSQFLYFYFAPTLVYKDVYPRSETRNWSFIVSLIAEFFGVILLASFILEVTVINQFVNYGLRPYSRSEILLIFLNNVIFGLILACSLFYIILHIWLNMFAELMKFSNRVFYKDWWTSLNYERYYRTWNVVVQEWLYTYIYKDFCENVYSKSKTPAKLLVFLISAVFHEYVLGFTFRFCMPILSFLWLPLGLPVMAFRIKPNIISNIYFLYTFGLGFGIFVTVLAMEYYSRVNCPVENIRVIDYFIPQLFKCNK